jgi:hypothetical protein
MSKLSKLCLVLLVALMPAISHAQKCNLDIDEADAFTKEHVKAGTSSVGGAMWHWKLTLKQSGAKYGWEMQIKYSKHFQDDIKTGDVIYCKLENGKVIKLIADNNYAPSHNAFSDGVIITTYLPKGNLDASDMKDFSESPLSEIRVTLSGTNIEPNISSKQGNNLKEIAACILKP